MHPLAMTSLRLWQLTHTVGGHPVRKCMVDGSAAQPPLALPLGELARLKAVTERAGMHPMAIRVCDPGSRPTPLGVTRFGNVW